MNRPSSLSPEFSAAYRLLLRAISASVLHHPTATRNLRKLYRPCFVDAAKIDVEKQNTRDAERRKLLEKWISSWNERVDNTLKLLLSSATSRGLSHRVTRNLGLLTDSYLQRPKPSGVWDPQLPTVSPLYKPVRVVLSEKEVKRSQRERIDGGVFQALGQVVTLAEGQSKAHMSLALFITPVLDGHYVISLPDKDLNTIPGPLPIIHLKSPRSQ